MKAAFLTSPRTLDVREVPEPDVANDGLVMETKACGICGSDLRRWKEGPPSGCEGITPGHEASGVVIKVGPQCHNFEVGDHIAIAPDVHCSQCYYCKHEMYNLCDNLRFVGITPGYPGGFAEQMALTGEILGNGIVNKMPEGLSFTHAAVSELCNSVLATHEKAGTGSGDTVVVIGAGPAGCLHVCVAKSRGARVVVLEIAETRRKMAERFEPDLVMDASEVDLVDRVKKFTSGVGADIIVCANPIAQTHALAVDMVRKGGKVMLFGGLPKANPMTTLNGNTIHYGEIEVIGAFSYHPRFHTLSLNLLAEKKLPIALLITHTFELGKINEAYQTAVGGEALKVVIEIGRQ
ncbi:MAG: alcohol dehydrogenase catalytic domain-containing protein [Sedimentisphaerales bacterium]|nr:alcohol dehydrogenase catalytic domain-containing protein [Sedimentisphaerales bacterium]